MNPTEGSKSTRSLELLLKKLLRRALDLIFKLGDTDAQADFPNAIYINAAAGRIENLQHQAEQRSSRCSFSMCSSQGSG